jgi:hypothetical protein
LDKIWKECKWKEGKSSDGKKKIPLKWQFASFYLVGEKKLNILRVSGFFFSLEKPKHKKRKNNMHNLSQVRSNPGHFA